MMSDEGRGNTNLGFSNPAHQTDDLRAGGPFGSYLEKYMFKLKYEEGAVCEGCGNALGICDWCGRQGCLSASQPEEALPPNIRQLCERCWQRQSGRLDDWCGNQDEKFELLAEPWEVQLIERPFLHPADS